MTVQINITLMIKHVQRTVDVDLHSGRYSLRLGLGLCSQKVIQVAEDRHILGTGILQILAVDKPRTAVDNRLFNRRQTVLAADDQIT